MRVRRDDRRQILDGTGRGPALFGVDQAIATHPDVVGGAREVGDQVAPLIVRDDSLAEVGAQVGCFDDPTACLGPGRPGHRPSDLVDSDRAGKREPLEDAPGSYVKVGAK